MLQDAMATVADKLPWIENLLNVHDEIVFQTYPRMMDQSIKDIKFIMEKPISINGREVSIPVDFAVGPNWGEMEEVK
jgi:DNA polymerase I-like protein with 3'-5' exonuclease and polymerase domains